MRARFVHAPYLTTPLAARQPARLAALLFLAGLLVFPAAPAAAQSSIVEPPATAIGEILGPDFTVKGQVGISVREGRMVTRLESGNEVTVRRGQALVRLENDAGSIRFCEPMRASLLKSQGGLTVAFNRGTLRIEARGAEAILLHTPWFAITAPQAEENGARAAMVGLDRDGKLCLRTLAGEWTVREQLAAGELAVPAGNTYVIEPNKLTEPRHSDDACACAEENLEEPVRPSEPGPVKPSADAAAASTSTEKATSSELNRTQPAAKETKPEWKAVMPPLVFEANAANAAAAEAAASVPAVLVPASWQGEVVPREAARAEAGKGASPRTGFVERMKHFFRALFGSRRKPPASD